MNKLFSHVERKLKKAAKVIFVLGLTLCVIYILMFLYQATQYLSYDGMAAVGMLLGSSISTLVLIGSVLLSSWCLYGFGELIEYTKSNNGMLWEGLYGKQTENPEEGQEE